MIYVGISDHQLIYCTRKIKRIKHNMNNQIQVQPLKNYIAEIFTNELKAEEEIRIKNNTQDWFDNDIAETIKIREKYFEKFKKWNLQIGYNFYIETKYNTQELVKQKKIEFLNTKLTENIDKPKELRMSLKPLGLASIKSP